MYVYIVHTHSPGKAPGRYHVVATCIEDAVAAARNYLIESHSRTLYDRDVVQVSRGERIVAIAGTK